MTTLGTTSVTVASPERDDLLPHRLATLAADDPDAVAVEEIGGRTLTWHQLLESTLRWANAFRRLGVEPGDHVVTMLPNSLVAYEAWLGLTWLHAIEAPINPGYQGVLLGDLVSRAHASVAVVAERFLDTFTAAVDRSAFVAIVVPDGDDGFLDGVPPALDLPGPDLWDIAALIYTSGTTGPSKGVLVPWGTLWSFATTGPDDLLEPGGAYYGMYPANHISGKYTLYQAARYGARLVVRERFSVEHFWADVREHGVTGASLVGAMAPFLMLQPERPDDADHPLRYVMMAPLAPDVDAFERRFGVAVGTGYGMSEIGIVFEARPGSLPNGASCGRPRGGWPGYEVRIVDEHDRPVPAGDVGELIVRASEPWVLNQGYDGMTDVTAAAWRNGWFHTGDGFRVDDDGNYYFADRMKDTIRRRGENISSFEVEACALAHPDVAECAAIAVPSDYTEDDVKVCVVAREGATLTPEQLIEFLTPRMPAFMVPRYVELTDALPKTEATMRTQKVKLRETPLTESTWDRERSRPA